MFSGIVEESGTVLQFKESATGYMLQVRSALDHSRSKTGDSIAIEGVCLTIVALKADEQFTDISFDVAAETCRRSTLGSLEPGSTVNIERALQLGEGIHGHLVTGHVDAVVKLKERQPDGGGVRLVWELPERFRCHIAEKGSVTLAGVSLTVGEVADDTFCVYIVPHTDEVTTLSEVHEGQPVNFEVDLFARYIVNALSVTGVLPAGVHSVETIVKSGGWDERK